MVLKKLYDVLNFGARNKDGMPFVAMFLIKFVFKKVLSSACELLRKKE